MALKAGYVGVKRWLYEKLQATAAKNVQDIANIWDNNAITGVHNYLNVNDIKAKSGATITIGSTGFTSVVSSASWSGAEYVRSCDPGVDMVLSLDTAITSGVTYIAVQGSSDGTNYTNIKTSAVLTASGSVKLEFNTGTYTSLKVIFYTTNATVTACNVTISNILLKRAEDPSNDVTPFAMTNQQLTKSIVKTTGTFDQVTANKSGYMVELSFTGTTITNEDGKTLGTLDAAYRPGANINLYTKVYNGSSYVDAQVKVTASTGSVELLTLQGNAVTGAQVNFLLARPVYMSGSAAGLTHSISDTREASPEVIADDPEPVTKTTKKTTKKEDN